MLKILLAAAALFAPCATAAQTVVTVNGRAFEVPAGTTTTFGIGPDGPYVINQVAVAAAPPPAYVAARPAAASYQPAPRLEYAELDPVEQPAFGEARTMRIKRDRTSGHFIANVRVNGVVIRCIIDTGAGSTILSPEDAAATGVDRDVTHVRPGIGIGGYTTLRSTRVRSLEIGGQRLGSFAADIGQSGLPTLLGQPEIAKLGRIVIEDGVMEIQPRGIQTASR